MGTVIKDISNEELNEAIRKISESETKQEGVSYTESVLNSHNKPRNQKIIPKDTSKKSIVEFLMQEDSTGKYSERIREYSNKNRTQVKRINQSHDNFVSVMGDKMSSTELTYLRFKQIVDTAVKAMSEKNEQSTGVLKTLVVMDNSKFSDDAVYEKNFKLLDDNFSENEKNVSVVFDITLKLSQMKNKNASVDHAGAMDELTSLQKNIDGYIK
jgi:hypothetical protein